MRSVNSTCRHQPDPTSPASRAGAINKITSACAEEMGGEASTLSAGLPGIFWGGSGTATADQFRPKSFRVFAKSCSYQYSPQLNVILTWR